MLRVAAGRTRTTLTLSLSSSRATVCLGSWRPSASEVRRWTRSVSNPPSPSRTSSSVYLYIHFSTCRIQTIGGLTRTARPNDDLPPLRQQKSIDLLNDSPTIRMILITPSHLDQDCLHPLILQHLLLRMQGSPTRWLFPHLPILYHHANGHKVLHAERFPDLCNHSISSRYIVLRGETYPRPHPSTGDSSCALPRAAVKPT